MAIDVQQAKIGFHVFYQQPYMSSPEYGLIKSLHATPRYVHVLFTGDMTAKACRPCDLYWPPDYCAMDRVNPPGQPFSAPQLMPQALV